MLRHTSRFDSATCHPPSCSRIRLGRRTSRRHVVVTSATGTCCVITQENALVDILATLTLNTLVPERAVVPSGLASSAHNNFRASRIVIAGTVFRRIVACRIGKISAVASTTVTFPASISHSHTLDRRGVQSMCWSPRFPHGSHTPNHDDVEADATLLSFRPCSNFCVREIASSYGDADATDKYAPVLH